MKILLKSKQRPGEGLKIREVKDNALEGMVNRHCVSVMTLLLETLSDFG